MGIIAGSPDFGLGIDERTVLNLSLNAFHLLLAVAPTKEILLNDDILSISCRCIKQLCTF